MTDKDKTDKSVSYVLIHDSKRLPISLLVPCQDNPQFQDGATFSQLVEGMKEIGMAESVLVSGPFDDGKYKIIGGHHKIEACRVAGLSEAPCMILPPMSDDEIKILVIRMNAVKGKIDPIKFTRLFNSLAKKMDPSVLRAKMGITSEKMFNQLYRDIRKSLPTPEMQKKLDESAREVKDVEGLAGIVRRIFTEHGEQLEYRFLVFEYGGQTHLMLKMSTRTAENIDRLCKEALEKKTDLNFYINRLLEQRLPDVETNEQEVEKKPKRGWKKKK